MDDRAIIAGFRPIPDPEIEYRPIAPWSIAALILGVLSLAAVLLPVGIALGLVGAIVGGCSWQTIRQSRLSWAGGRLAAAGFFLSLSAAAGGSAYQVWESRHQQYLRTCGGLVCPPARGGQRHVASEPRVVRTERQRASIPSGRCRDRQRPVQVGLTCQRRIAKTRLRPSSALA